LTIQGVKMCRCGRSVSPSRQSIVGQPAGHHGQLLQKFWAYNQQRFAPTACAEILGIMTTTLALVMKGQLSQSDSARCMLAWQSQN